MTQQKWYRSVPLHPENFDAVSEVNRIRERLAVAKRKTYRRDKSSLDEYRTQLVALRKVGATYAVLAEWLRVNHRVRVSRSTIFRYLTKLPELGE